MNARILKPAFVPWQNPKSQPSTEAAVRRAVQIHLEQGPKCRVQNPDAYLRRIDQSVFRNLVFENSPQASGRPNLRGMMGKDPGNESAASEFEDSCRGSQKLGGGEAESFGR